MNWKQLDFAALLAGFSALTVYALMEQGLVGAWDVVSGSPWGAQIAVDLVIGLGVACLYIYKDAPRRGMARWPFIGLTFLTGSISVLLYLVIASGKTVSDETPERRSAATTPRVGAPGRA